MKSLIAALRSLTLPFGRTSGARIVLDGVNGQILFYDTTNTLRWSVRVNSFGTALMEFPLGDVDEISPADIATFLLGGGAANAREGLDITAGRFAGAGQPQIKLLSESRDGTSLPGSIELRGLNGAPLRLGITDGAATGQPMGVATLVAGTVTVNTPWITAATRVFTSRQALGGTAGHLSITRVVGTSFTITSSSAVDTSTIAWLLLDPV